MKSTLLLFSLMIVFLSNGQLISTVSGNGNYINPCSDFGLYATNSSIRSPYGVVVDKKGNILYVENIDDGIRKVDIDGKISSIAGCNGKSTHSGDGGPVYLAGIEAPYGLAIDEVGNIYFSEQYADCVRKIDTNGIITTIAGIVNSSGFSGDGGLATNAKLNQPRGLAIDKDGNLFIADYANFRIRKVSANGIITTVAGNGTFSFSGDGGLATAAGMKQVTGVAVDNNANIYIADHDNSRVRKVNSTGIISTFAGGGTGTDGGLATAAKVDFPWDVDCDKAGNVYIVHAFKVRMVDINGIISTVAGNENSGYNGDGIPATVATLTNPSDVFLDSTGNIYISDFGNHRIRKVSSSVLAIKLQTFSIQHINNEILLQWQTSYEERNSHYEILRSTDAINFLSIDTVKSVSNGNVSVSYKYFDKTPITNSDGWVSYKLRAIDEDGISTYSNIEKIKIPSKSFSLQLSPNPTSSYSLLTISGKQTKVNLKIFSSDGKLIYKDYDINSNNHYKLPVEFLSKGIYIVTVYNFEERRSIKLIKY